MLKKVGSKIILSYSLLILILILFLLLFFNDLVGDFHLKVIKREMTEKIDFIELVLQQNKKKNKDLSQKRIEVLTTEISDIINLRLTILGNNGIVIADSSVDEVELMDNHRYRVEIIDAFKHGFGESIRYSNTLKTDMLYSAKMNDEFIIRLSKPLYEIDESLGKIKGVIILLGVILLSVATIINIILTQRTISPIKEALLFAEDFSRGDLSRRILNYRDDEIGKLQVSLNTLADTLQDKIRSLMLEQRKFETTIESINDALVVINNNGNILLHNKRFLSFLNINTPIYEKIYYEIIRNSVLNKRILDSLGKGTSNRFEVDLLNGRFCEVFINPYIEDDAIEGIVVSLHDVTEKKKADRVKSELVGNLSHELKTPIAIVKGYLETIDDHLEDTELCKSFINKAMININRQNSIINDMLKLNMLETAPDFLLEDIDISEIIEGCLNILSLKITKKNIHIENRAKSLPLLKANKFLAEEIFFNILDNAIDYNKDGGSVTVEAEELDRLLAISITDTGIGIPMENIDRIFERFYRVEKSRSRFSGGTGLGLSIVKHSAEILNWKVEVISTGGQTIFTVKASLSSVRNEL